MRFMMVTVLVGLSLSANAEFVSGNMLRTWLRESEKSDAGTNFDLQQAAQSMGYLKGVYDAARSVWVCPPDGVTVGQVERIVIKHLDANPEQWARPADVLVVAALSQAFPCKR